MNINMNINVNTNINTLTNILPLSTSAHARWNRFEFGLQPVAHPTEPTRHLYLQMVWLGRAGQGQPCMAVEHGNVFDLVSSDPVAFPLPSFRLLEIQHAVHKLMAGMHAPATLRLIFGGGKPPPDEGPVPQDLPGLETVPIVAPGLWLDLLDLAIEEDMIDADAAQRWNRAFQWRQYYSLSMGRPLEDLY